MIKVESEKVVNQVGYDVNNIDQRSIGMNGSAKILSISQTSGVPLFEKIFDNNFIKYTGSLFTIGIHALRVFLLDTFDRPNIAQIKIDDLTVRIVNIDDVIIYFVYTGDSIKNENKFDDFLARLVTMDFWTKFRTTDYLIFEKDTSSISLMAEEIFAG